MDKNDLEKHLKRIKQNALNCKQRCIDTTNTLVELREKLQKIREENANSFTRRWNHIFRMLNYPVSKVGVLANDSLSVDDTFLNKLNKAFVAKYGTNYSIDYKFQFDTDNIADQLVDSFLEKKRIYTNILCKKIHSTPIGEYAPVYVDVYCPKGFDASKRYTITELKKLIKDKQIVLKRDVSMDLDYSAELSHINSCIKRSKPIMFGKISYSPTNIKILRDDEQLNALKLKCALDDLNDNSYRLPPTKYYETKQGCAIIKTLMALYPRAEQVIDEEIDRQLDNDILLERQKNAFVKDFYIEATKAYLNKVEKSVANLNDSIDDYKNESFDLNE